MKKSLNILSFKLFLLTLMMMSSSHLWADAVVSWSENKNTEHRKIAVLLPQSGPHADYGQLQFNGYKCAEVEILRTSKDHQIKYFDVGTDHSDLEKYLEEEVMPWNPDLLVGPYSSQCAVRVAEFLSHKKIPLLIPTATLDSLSKKTDSNVFRLASTAGFMARLTTDYINENRDAWGLNSIMVIAEKSDFSKGIIKEFMNIGQQEKESLAVKIIEYNIGELSTVFHPTEWGPSAVISITRSKMDCQKLATAATREPFKFFGCSSGYLTPTFKKFAKEKSLELYLITPWQDDRNSPVVKDFIQQYQRKFNNAFSTAYPQYHSVQAYSSLITAYQASLDAQSKNVNIFDALSGLNMQTPLGDIRFVNFSGYYRQVPTTVVIQSVKEGIPRTVYPFDQAKKNQSVAKRVVTKKLSAIEMILSNQVVSLFVIIALGLIIGEITIFNVSFGSSAVIFVALVFGHFKFTIPSGIGTLGLIIFMYCVGVSAGPAFFRAFASKGVGLAKLGLVVVSSAAMAIFVSSKIFNVPISLASGIFAGALTSTPALAAAMDNLKDSGALVSVGYGIAYPFGVIGVVLFVQLIPKLLKIDLNQLAKEVGKVSSKTKIVREWIEVNNESLAGQKISESHVLDAFSCQMSRLYIDGRVFSITEDATFRIGMVVLVIGEKNNLAEVISILGKIYDQPIHHTLEQERCEIVITSKNIVGKTIQSLATLKNFGLLITRVQRGETQFIPKGKTVLENVDKLTVVGLRDEVKIFMKFAGHRSKALNETDLLSLIGGVLLGVLLGMVSFSLPGGSAFSLGMSGGPLLVALILGYFGKFGKITGRFPPAALNILRDLGLVFFLAQAGIKAGGAFVETIQEYGAVLFFVGALVTITPMVTGYFWATKVMKLNLLEALGGICGGMTSTPALGSIAGKTDSEIPIVSYATAYPVALILMIICVQLIIELSATFFLS
jgi:putative transport protein